MSSEYECISYVVSEHILTITLNRPEKKNTMTFLGGDELHDAIARADADDDVRAVILTGAGDYFCAGVDLASAEGMNPNLKEYVPMEGRARDPGGLMTMALFELKKFLICAFNGPAIGFGMGVSLPADVRLSVDSARFAIPMARRGFAPESNITWFLPRIVGISRAIEWAATGRYISATEAREAGFVRELLPKDKLMERAREIARDVVENCAPVSVALIRALMWRNLNNDLNESNRLDTMMLQTLARSPDTKEGIAAFLEKRKPDFPMTVNNDMPRYYPWWRPRAEEWGRAPLAKRKKKD